MNTAGVLKCIIDRNFDRWKSAGSWVKSHFDFALPHNIQLNFAVCCIGYLNIQLQMLCWAYFKYIMLFTAAYNSLWTDISLFLFTWMILDNFHDWRKFACRHWRQIKEIKKHNILLRSLSLQGVGLKDFVQQAIIFDPSRLSVTSCKNTFPKQMSSPSTFNLTT